MDELQSCPWCGNPTKFNYVQTIKDDPAYCEAYAIECRKCCARGPARLSRSSASEAWNDPTVKRLAE